MRNEKIQNFRSLAQREGFSLLGDGEGPHTSQKLAHSLKPCENPPTNVHPPTK